MWHDPFPKPSYLFALVGGKLGCVEDSFRTMSGRKVALRIYVEPGKEGRCGYAMDALKRSMRWDEEAFGREYDLDIFMIVAVSDFNMGAMENKGLNIFNDKLCAGLARHRDRCRFRRDRGDHRARIFPQLDRQPHHLPRLVSALPEGRPDGLTATRSSPPTCARARWSASADVRDAARRISSWRMPARSPIRSGPALYHEINNFYTATVYEKGAEVVRMLQALLGPRRFPQGHGSVFRAP